MMLRKIFLLSSLLCFSDAYSPFGMTTRRSAMTMKRGRGSFKREIDSSGSSGKGIGGGAGMSSSPSRSSRSSNSAGASTRNWVLIPNSTTKDLPSTEGQVRLLDTKFKPLVDDATNPTGAISTLRYGPDIYCFSSSCPTCKIPLTKAQALPANEETGKSPRLSCDFCKATFNLKTGEKVKSVGGSGILGNIAKTVLSANESGPLPIYQLGDKNGQLVISID